MGDMDLIWVKREGKYFCKWDWTDPKSAALAIVASHTHETG
jgi:hypothetical protein